MAAYFQGNHGNWIPRGWHLGNAVPDFIRQRRVVTIQADGHELEAILMALQSAYVKPDSSVEICRKFHEAED